MVNLFSNVTIDLTEISQTEIAPEVVENVHVTSEDCPTQLSVSEHSHLNEITKPSYKEDDSFNGNKENINTFIDLHDKEVALDERSSGTNTSSNIDEQCLTGRSDENQVNVNENSLVVKSLKEIITYSI